MEEFPNTNVLEVVNELKYNITYKDKEYQLNINSTNDHIIFILKNDKEFPPEFYQEEYDLDKLKKNNLLFSLYTKIDDIISFLKINIEENKYTIEIANEKVLLTVKSGVVGIPDIKLLIKKKEKNEKNIIPLICEEINNLKEKISIFEQNKNDNNPNYKNNKKSEIFLKTTKRYECYKEIIYGINIFPNGNFIAYSGSKETGGKLYVFEGKKKKNVYKIAGEHKHAISYLEIISNNDFITCSFDKKIILWNINGIKPIVKETLEGHSGKIFKVIYINPKIYSCGEKGEIFVWEKKDQKYICSKKLEALEGKSIIYNLLQLNQNQFISSDSIGNLICWSIQKLGQEFKMKVDKSKWNHAISKINDTKILFGGKKFIQLINLKDQIIEKSIKVKSIIFSIDLLNDEYFICGDNQGKLTVREINTLDKKIGKTIKDSKKEEDKKDKKIGNEILYCVKRFDDKSFLMCSSHKKIYLFNYKNNDNNK